MNGRIRNVGRCFLEVAPGIIVNPCFVRGIFQLTEKRTRVKVQFTNGQEMTIDFVSPERATVAINYLMDQVKGKR